jgi:hypothetical protein
MRETFYNRRESEFRNKDTRKNSDKVLLRV